MSTVTAIATSTTDDTDAPLVRVSSPLHEALTLQGVDMAHPGAERAIGKAITGLARDLMEGAALLASDDGHSGAKRAVAALRRVRLERDEANARRNTGKARTK